VLETTFIRKLLRLKAHKVTQVQETETSVVIHIERLKRGLLRCGVCRQRCRTVHQRRPKEGKWRDLSLRDHNAFLCYQPYRVDCPRCAVRVESVPWAEPWARVTRALARSVAVMARDLSGLKTARHYQLNWRTVARIIRPAVAYGLRHGKRRPLHVIGIDEVSRRKGHRLPG